MRSAEHSKTTSECAFSRCDTAEHYASGTYDILQLSSAGLYILVAVLPVCTQSTVLCSTLILLVTCRCFFLIVELDIAELLDAMLVAFRIVC